MEQTIDFDRLNGKLRNFIMLDEWFKNDVSLCLQELQAYKQAEEQGLLVRLPIPIGSKVNFIDKSNNDEIYKQAVITGLGLSWTNESDIGDYIPLSIIGNTVLPVQVKPYYDDNGLEYCGNI